MPSTFIYEIKSALCHSENKYLEVKLLANVRSQDDAKEWVRSFSEMSKTSWSTRAAPAVTGKRVVFKLVLGCIHKGRTDRRNSDINPGVRNTNCPAQIIFTIFSTIPSKQHYYIKKSVTDFTKPCEIYLRLNHNHPIHASDVLRFRPVSEEVKEKLVELFHNGHTVATAREVLRIDIQTNHPDTYEELLADRHTCPDYRSCYYLYTKEFEREYGPMNSRDYNFLITKLSEYNEACGETPSASWEVSENECIIAICTPLMRRAHRLTPEASEVVFIDSSGTVDRDGHRIFLLLTHNESGGIPLGVIITSSESAATLTKAMHMLKDLIGVEGFFGTIEGPSIFMTDDCNSERSSLHSVWPKAKLLLCLFHVLQAIWRWLQQGKHAILKSKRVHLYHGFKRIIYGKTPSECCSHFENLKTAPETENCKNFLDHITTR